MDNIKIVKLQSGEEIITDLTEISESAEVILDDPMCIVFKRLPDGKSVMLMSPWLPVELIEDNRAVIFSGDILTILQPRKSLIEYYNKLVYDHSEEVESYIEEFDKSMMEDLYQEYDNDGEDGDGDGDEEVYHVVTGKQLLH